MSELRSLLDELMAVDNQGLTVDELNTDVVELCRGIDRMKVLVAEKTAALEQSGGLRELGYPSTTAYLVHVGRMSVGRARRFATRVKARSEAPGAYAAWADGRLSSDQAAHLFRVSEAVPDSYGDAEDTLVEIVEPLSVRDTARVVEYWRQAFDGPGDLDLETQMNRRGVSLSQPMHGMRHVDGWMTLLAAEAFEAGLLAHMAPAGPDDTRTARQRRHDALEEMANCHLTHMNESEVGGERSTVSVLTDLDGLRGIAGGTHETVDTGQILDVETIRLISCDASLTRLVLGPRLGGVGHRSEDQGVDRRRNGGPSSAGTAPAPGMAVSDPPSGPTSITSTIGQTEGPPPSRTEPCSAGSTTSSPTSETPRAGDDEPKG